MKILSSSFFAEKKKERKLPVRLMEMRLERKGQTTSKGAEGGSEGGKAPEGFFVDTLFVDQVLLLPTKSFSLFYLVVIFSLVA